LQSYRKKSQLYELNFIWCIMASLQENTPPASEVYTPRDAILYSAQHLKKIIAVQGTIAMVDLDLSRIDICHQGAKLIVRLPPGKKQVEYQLDHVVLVQGVLRKEQRRTFLMASSVERVCGGLSE